MLCSDVCYTWGLLRIINLLNVLFSGTGIGGEESMRWFTKRVATVVISAAHLLVGTLLSFYVPFSFFFPQSNQQMYENAGVESDVDEEDVDVAISRLNASGESDVSQTPDYLSYLTVARIRSCNFT
jgi:hypothetical protein